MIKTLMLCTVVFSFSALQAVEWYEEGDGGYAYSNGNVVPSNYNDFLYNNSVTYEIQDADGATVGDAGDFLGAFYEGQLRGIIPATTVDFGPNEGTNMFPLLMFSNASGSETFNLKFYDASDDAVSDLPETYLFISDDPQGDFFTPVSLTVTLDDDVSCDDVDEDGICDDVDDCVGDYDECGMCNGNGIGDGECDCDGNILDCLGICGGNAQNDCLGECGGSAVVDECGICNGDGSSCESSTVLSISSSEINAGETAVLDFSLTNSVAQNIKPVTGPWVNNKKSQKGFCSGQAVGRMLLMIHTAKPMVISLYSHPNRIHSFTTN